jgi:two-component system alkaline phosphatase synthesis response regulator PhoP
MQCKAVQRAMSHGELSDEALLQIQAHLETCDKCRDFAEFLQMVEKRIAQLPAYAPPALAEQIRKRLGLPVPAGPLPDFTMPMVGDRKETRKMPRILAVDDEPNIVRLMQVTLERQGYRVETANNGAQALAKIRASRPDLLVSDVMMPEMDGFELLSNIRRDTSLNDLPVIMLTAKTQDSNVMEGYARGADMYLTKPFNPMELIQFVKRILASEGEESDTYRI